MWSIKRRTCFNEGRVSSKNNHRIAVDVGYCSSVGLCIVQAADFFDAYLLAPGLLLHKLLGAVIRSRPVSAVNSERSNQPGLVRIIVTRFVEALNCTHVSRSSTLWPNDVAYHALGVVSSAYTFSARYIGQHSVILSRINLSPTTTQRLNSIFAL